MSSLPLNQIICGDCLDIMKSFPSESVDCIITDPPYGIKKKEIIGDESLKVYRKALPLMERVLKKDKWFITFASIERIHDVIEITEKYFKYVWLGFIYYHNMERILHSPIGFSKISLFLIFKKGNPKKHYWLRDVLPYTYTRKTNFYGHPSPKPVSPITELVKFGTKERDIILDPFVGVGAICIAAAELGRYYIGIEINPKYVEITKKRIKQIQIPKLEEF